MNVVKINLEALNHNFQRVNNWIKDSSANWTLVTKVLCGHTDTLRALQRLGVRSMGDSRLDNLRAIERIAPGFESWYLRLPHLSAIPDIVKLSEVSLNSEIEIIERLNQEAKKQDKIHRIIIMIELGDLREGILPSALVKFYEHIFDLPNIEVLGVGANLGCLSGAIPNIDQLTHLILYRELLELKFQHKLPMISAGSSITLPMLLDGTLPRAINHFRIGEAVFLGTDIIHGGTLEDLRDDAITLEVEIAEIKKKSLIPLGETTTQTPFEVIESSDITPGQRGYRAVITIGQLDTEVSGLKPIKPHYQIAGASSDLSVLNIGDNPDALQIGDSIEFKLNYSALLHLMAGNYVRKTVHPSIETFFKNFESSDNAVPRVIEQYD